MLRRTQSLPVTALYDAMSHIQSSKGNLNSSDALFALDKDGYAVTGTPARGACHMWRRPAPCPACLRAMPPSAA